MPELTLTTKIGADGSGFLNVMKDLQREVGVFGKAIGGISRGFKGFLGVAGVTAAIQGIRAVAQEMSELQDAHEKTGISAGTLDDIERVAKKSGASLADHITAIKNTALATVKAKAGQDAFVDALVRLGVTADELKSKSIEQIYFKIAAGAKSGEISAQKLADLTTVMGKNALHLLPSFREGFQGISDISRIETEIAAKEFDKLGDRASDTGHRISKVFRNIFSGFAIVGNDVLDKLFGGKGQKAAPPSLSTTAEAETAEDAPEETKAQKRAREQKAARISTLKEQLTEQAFENALTGQTVEQQLSSLKNKAKDFAKEAGKLMGVDEEKSLEFLNKASDIDGRIKSLLNQQSKADAKQEFKPNIGLTDAQKVGAFAAHNPVFNQQKEANKYLREISDNTKPKTQSDSVIF